MNVPGPETMNPLCIEGVVFMSGGRLLEDTGYQRQNNSHETREEYLSYAPILPQSVSH